MGGKSFGNMLVRNRSRSSVSCDRTRDKRGIFPSHQDTLRTDHHCLRDTLGVPDSKLILVCNVL